MIPKIIGLVVAAGLLWYAIVDWRHNRRRLRLCMFLLFACLTLVGSFWDVVLEHGRQQEEAVREVVREKLCEDIACLEELIFRVSPDELRDQSPAYKRIEAKLLAKARSTLDSAAVNIATDEPELALEKLSRVLANVLPEAERARVEFFRGCAFSLRAMHDSAIAAYQTSLAIATIPSALLNIAVCLAHQGKYESALVVCDSALAIEPAWFEALYNKSSCLRALDRHEEAIANCDAALRVKPNHHQALVNRGYSLANLERHEEAIASYDAVLGVKPNHHQALVNKGYSLADLGRHEEAIACYDAALKIGPDDHETLYNKGNSLAITGRYEAAIVCYDAAIKLEHGLLDARANKGNCHSELGQLAAAISCYDRALRIAPNYTPVIYNKAIAYAKAGERGLMLSSLEDLVGLDSTWEQQIQTDTGFEAYWGDPDFRKLVGSE